MKKFLVKEEYGNQGIQSFMIVEHESLEKLKDYIFNKFKNNWIEYNNWFDEDNPEPLSAYISGSQDRDYWIESEDDILEALEIIEITDSAFEEIKNNITKPEISFGCSCILHNAGF